MNVVESKADAPLRLGFIGGGTGSVVGSAHAAAATLDKRFSLVAGCFSRDAAVSRASGERYGVAAERCGTDWRHWLGEQAGELDAVAVLTPIPDHARMVEHALSLGVPVICEKALVGSVSEADALQRTIDAQAPGSSDFLAVTLNYSGYPIVRRMRQLVRDGELGRISDVQLEMPLENYRRVPIGAAAPAPAQAWRRRDGSVPTLLLDLGVHLQHLLDYLVGEPIQTVMADLQRDARQAEPLVDDARIWLRGCNGLAASMWMSKRSLGHRNGLRIRVLGDCGAAEWQQCDPEILHRVDRHGRRSTHDRGLEDELLATPHFNRFKAGHPAGYVEAFGNLYWDLADALQQHRRQGRWAHEDVFGLAHSRNGLAVLEAAVASDRTGTWTSVARTGDCRPVLAAAA